MTTSIVAIVAFVLYLVGRSADELAVRSLELTAEGRLGLAQWVDRVVSWSGSYRWLTVLLFAAVIALALARRASASSGAVNPLAVQRGLQTVTLLHVVAVPVLAPFARMSRTLLKFGDGP